MSESFSLPIASIAQIPPLADPVVEGVEVPPSDFTIEEVELAPLPEEDPSPGLAANAPMPPDPLQMLIEGLSGITAALRQPPQADRAQAASALSPRAGVALPDRAIAPMVETAPAPTPAGDPGAEAPAAPDSALPPTPPEASPALPARLPLAEEAPPAVETAGAGGVAPRPDQPAVAVTTESDGPGQPQATLPAPVLPLLRTLKADPSKAASAEPTRASASAAGELPLPWREAPTHGRPLAAASQTTKAGRRDEGIEVALEAEDPGRLRVVMAGTDQPLAGDPARELAGAVTPDLAAPLTGAPRDVASAVPHPPLHRVPMAAVARQIADAVVTAREDRIEITLAPEELGRIRMIMSGPEHSPHVLIWAERPEVLDQLRRNTAFLQECLGDAGMAEASVDFQGDGGSRDGAGDRRALPDAPPPGAELPDTVHRPVVWTPLAIPARLDIRI